ncbi:MAG TPA: PAS domain-containing protein [Ilumatobacter sp.]|nr:PAS domain-containing protein [Ilumatobacter sp.]
MDTAAGGVADEGRLRDDLRRAEQRLAAMIDNLREVVFQTDRAGNWVFLNDAWTRLFGYPVDESLGTFYQSAMHPDDQPASGARLAALLDGGKGECRAVFRMFHRNGSLRWAEITAQPLRDESGQMVGLAGTLNDVTERVITEQRLERERRRLIAAVEGTGIAVWERDVRTDEAWYSPEWARMLGYHPDEIAARQQAFLELVHPDDLAHHAREVAKSYSGEADYFEANVRMRHQLGHWVWIRTRGRVLEWSPDGTPAIAAGTHTEVTHQIAAEQAVRNAQRMAALGRIAGGIAHDFNNLLGVILGSTDLIEPDATDDATDDPAATARTAHALQVIRSATERATALTNRLLDIAQERTGTATVIDLDRAVDEGVGLIAQTLPDTIELVREPAGVELPIEVDPGLLGDSLLNLALNARDAMPTGGRLTIRTEHRPGAAPAGDRVAIVVSDTGEGIATDVQERIFEPYYSTKPPGEGTGLGLALVYAFVHQWDGDITVSSHVGAGTSFVIEFPRSARPLSVAVGSSQAEPPRGRGETVLVVDDEGLLRELARVQLEAGGYRVLLAADGPAALAVVDARPDIELVFSDVVMPGGMSGFDLAAAIRARYPDARVLLTSGFADNVPPGYEGTVLHKPYHRADLLAAVHTTLNT